VARIQAQQSDEACEAAATILVVIGKEHIAAVPPGETPQDERAAEQEHWIVHVEMVENLRKVNVCADQPQWEKLKVGDRINVTYSMGKYTGTVLDAEIR
jgi:hypothetical protein